MLFIGAFFRHPVFSFVGLQCITVTKCIQLRIEFLEITRVICGDRIFRVCVIWFTWSDDKFQSRRRKPKLASFFRAGFLGEGNMNYYRRKCDLLQKSNLSNNLTTDMEREGLGNPYHIGNEKKIVFLIIGVPWIIVVVTFWGLSFSNSVQFKSLLLEPPKHLELLRDN